MNLLIVNDIVIEAKTMASDIPWKDYGIENVFTAFSARQAREVIQDNTVDILLCDIEMPEENGLSLIRWIQENNYDIDCILLTLLSQVLSKALFLMLRHFQIPIPDSAALR